MSNDETRADQKPVGGLLSDLVGQVTALFRTEIDLLKSEMRASVQSLRGALVALAIGAALLIAALIVLVQAIVAGMVDAGMSVWAASLIVGLVLAAIGALLLKRGADRMSPSGMVPDRTVRQMQKDRTLVKETAK